MTPNRLLTPRPRPDDRWPLWRVLVLIVAGYLVAQFFGLGIPGHLWLR